MLPPPSPNVSSRPTPLVAGALICGVAVLATILEGAFWIAFWSEISDLASAEISDPEAEEVFSVYRSMLILVVAGSSLLGFLTMGGAIAAMTGKNWGRIIVWVAGGVVALWHLCCSGYTLLFRAVFTQVSNEAQAQDGYDPTQDVSMWMVDAAIISGFIAAVAVLIGIILIAQSSVNAYFRALKPPPPPQYNPYGYPPQGPYGGPPYMR
ncbi:MAG TPA: hypothetical protein H9902_06355 [Candidatus Stackebrandtia faecavium]|nr:hypothetical protein [Candidatus Stackebrandtia faecavium]